MFLLGACWVQNPLRVVLGLKTHILVKFCNPSVKNPHFVVAECIGVKG